MLYRSTRGGKGGISAAAAIAQGLSDDGGLYVPESFPILSQETITNLVKMNYAKRASYILGLFLNDFTASELESYADLAYGEQSGFTPEAAPIHMIDSTTGFLELWHGPTCAFKDIALQIMPRLLTASLQKTNEKREVCVLVATSGDTGKAALEGFCDVPGTRVMVFYPRDGVSEVQKLQMISQTGSNVNVVAVEGNFDDAQTGVKAIFSDSSLRERLNERGFFLSSANSINWGRLVPQIAYYVSAYCDLLSDGRIRSGEKINFCVPTGNFGNILAGYYAMKIGLPINKLICASNRNDVLIDFINTGVYDRNRPFYTTMSPSMDILISSNLERLLFELSDADGKIVNGYMSSLASSGRYELVPNAQLEMCRFLFGGSCFESDTSNAIAKLYNEHGYLMDTHTAVAYKVLMDYRNESCDLSTRSVVVSTASPYKFCDSVLAALGQESSGDGAGLIERLHAFTGSPIPSPLANLHDLKPRFTDSIPVSRMSDSVLSFLSRG